MSDQLIEVTYLDGTTEIVERSEAEELRLNGEIVIPESDGKALTIEDMYGTSYDQRLT